jgi:hypothetical protein
VDQVHSGSILFEPSNAMEVLQLSDYFGLVELKAGCGDYIAKSINTDTVAGYMQTAADFGEASLVEKCLHFIELHTDEVLVSESFSGAVLGPEMLCKVLQSDKLSCTNELTLYNATVAWGRTVCELQRHARDGDAGGGDVDLAAVLALPLSWVAAACVTPAATRPARSTHARARAHIKQNKTENANVILLGGR